MTKINKTYKYKIAVEGSGGEFAFIPMTPEQCAFWREKGEVAFADHLHHGWDDGTPAEFQLGSYSDADDCSSGIEPNQDGRVVVQDEEGKVVLEQSLLDFTHAAPIETNRVINEPWSGVLFRTYEKGAQMYDLVLSEPIDPMKLRLRGSQFPFWIIVNAAEYAGEEISAVNHIDKDRGFRSAELIG